ncbi:MAG: energy transducer TonB [Gammaproteobacteria bacterium]|tara:strand:+ start:4739 stop:5347 length:609 start_codon:yes stop_codon:yes gene_type:complete
MINYFTPLTLSILIHLGIIFSFSNIFNINFDQFNIESSKPIAAYIIFEEKKTIPIKKIQLNNTTNQEQVLSIKTERIEVSSAASLIEEIEAIENKINYNAQINLDLSSSDIEKFSSIIKQQVMENWKRPKNLNLKLKTEIQINLVPTGEILSATLIKGSGNKAFDESAMSAIYKVKTFEGLSMQMRLFDQHFRKFVLVFRPE